MTDKRHSSRRDERAYNLGFEYGWHDGFEDTAQRRLDDWDQRRPPPAPPRKHAWHDVLGVPPTASYDEARSAYRALVTRHHPDVGGEALIFLQIQEAWEQAQKKTKG